MLSPTAHPYDVLANSIAFRLFVVPLDSGVPRCRWHRVQLEADVPTGTSLFVQVASTDDPVTSPHPDDWHPVSGATVTTSPLDFLIDQPPGRFLLVRVQMRGDGVRTPVLRRVRLDFPRSTSLDSLPPVYRDNARAEDFTERFLSLFDAGVAELDAAIEHARAEGRTRGVAASAAEVRRAAARFVLLASVSVRAAVDGRLQAARIARAVRSPNA